LTLALLKTGILAAIYLLLYRCARMILHDFPRAVLATGSLLLVPLLAWEFLRDYTHSPLLCAFSVATLSALLRLQKKGRWRDYALLGLTLGLGVLSKYNYVHFAVALGGAALTMGPFRLRFLKRRMVLTLALAAAIVLPHGLRLVQHWTLIHSFLAERSGVGQCTGYLAGMAAGCGSLLYNAFLFLTPLWVIYLLCFPSGFRLRGMACSSTAIGQGLLGRFFMAAGLVLLLQVTSGATRFYVHWLEPFLIFLPIWFFGRLPLATLAPARLKGFAAVLVCAAVAILGVRAGEVSFNLNSAKHAERDRLFMEQVRQLQAAGFQTGTLVAGDHVIGGNLRLYFPRARVLCVEYPAYDPPAGDPDGPIVVVWNSTVTDKPLPQLRAYVKQKLGLDLNPGTRAQYLGDKNLVFRRHMNRLGSARLDRDGGGSVPLSQMARSTGKGSGQTPTLPSDGTDLFQLTSSRKPEDEGGPAENLLD
jgi:hypothetical protein